MKNVIALTFGLLLLVGAGLFVLYSGIYNISTGNHDTALVNWLLDTGMMRAVQYHAKGIIAPALTDPAMIRTGCAHYREMCVMCHAAPGVEPGEIAAGLWPTAPKLREGVSDWTPAELFWIIKYGIKFTAMPAWGPSHNDDQIWALVAFVEKQPQLSAQEYAAMASDAGTQLPLETTHHD